MPESVLDTSKPSPLRLVGFLFTAAGGLLIAFGSLQTWATVRFLGQTFPDSGTPGIDISEGKVTLVVGILVLVGIVVMRIVKTVGTRRAVALGICLGGVSALALGLITVSRAEDRFGGYNVEQIARQLSDASGVPLDRARADVQAVVDKNGSIDLGPGLWLVTAGGVVALIGGLLDLAWVGQQRLQDVDADVDPDA
jgi:hypothetical protein